MSQEEETQTDPQEDHNRVPSWYTEIFPAGPSDGFYHKMGYHAASFVDRGKDTLVVSFDNLSDAGYPHYDIEPWAGKFIAEQGYSHLGIYSRGPSWFRDAQLNAFFDNLRDSKFFVQFKHVALTGTSMGAFGALAFANHAPGSVVVALSPQTTLDLKKVSWEYRFQKAQGFDWSLPYSDAAKTVSKARRVYALYDPFLTEDRRHVERLGTGANITHLKGFGLGHKSAVVLRRMEQLKPVMARALTGELSEPEFYQMIRGRKDVFLYRRVMEEHLEARDRETLKPLLSSAFKKRRRRQEALKAAAAKAQESEAGHPAGSAPESAAPKPVATHAAQPTASHTAPRATKPVAPPAPAPGAPQRRPKTSGNAWMIEDRGDCIRYMSDQYPGGVMGYEDRGGVTLAQTADVAIGMLAYGAVSPTERPMPEDFRYHVVDSVLSGLMPLSGSKASGVAASALKRAGGRAYKTMIALSAQKASITHPEAQPDSALYTDALAQITAARAALAPWGKQLFVDRIAMRLLSGAPTTDCASADAHYVAVARALRRDVTTASGQGSYPLIVISQGAGTRTDGTSPVILAEGMLDIDNPTSGFVVATPTYPFAMMTGMPACLSPEAQMLVDELEARAVAEVQQGREWRCPSLSYAMVAEDQIRAEFTCASPLKLGKGLHGFSIGGCQNDVTITAAATEGNMVLLQCSGPPKGEALELRYAWGATADGRGTHAANKGALRDSWQADSILSPGTTLYRHALSGRVKLFKAKN